MVRCAFFGSDGNLTGFRITGHAGAGTKGTDIVCAAVSSAAYLVANTVTDVLHVPAQIQVEDGLLQLSLPQEGQASCQPLLQGLALHLSALSKDYPDHMALTFSEK